MDRRSFLKNLGLAAASVPVLARGKLIVSEDKEIIVPQKNAVLMEVDKTYRVTPVVGNIIQTSKLTMTAFGMSEMMETDTFILNQRIVGPSHREFEISMLDTLEFDLVTRRFNLIVDHIKEISPITCIVVATSQEVDMSYGHSSIQRVRLLEVSS